VIDITTMVDELIAAGCAPAVAARIVTASYLAGVQSMADRGNSGGIPVDSVAEKRRAYDRERKRKSTGIPPDSTGTPRNSENASLSKKDKKEDIKEEREALSEQFHRKPTTRGHRLPDDWQPAPADDATAIALIGPDRRAAELEKFRDHWRQQAGAKGVKADWDATWRNWFRRAAEFRPRHGPPARPLTQHQRDREESKEILNDLQKFIDASDGGGRDDADFGLLRFDPGDGQDRVHGGSRGDVVDLSTNRARKGN
jgi:hypothetical protein